MRNKHDSHIDEDTPTQMSSSPFLILGSLNSTFDGNMKSLFIIIIIMGKPILCKLGDFKV